MGRKFGACSTSCSDEKMYSNALISDNGAFNEIATAVNAFLDL